MLQKGPNQVHRTDNCVNKPNTPVGLGVYVTPHYETALQYALPGCIVNGKKYYLVMQCRVNPEAIKVSDEQTYWVLNNSRDIRPYGVLLFDRN